MAEEERVDQSGEVVERVAIFVRAGLVAVSEAQIVRCDDAEFRRELRDKITEHMRRRREAMQQDDGRRVGRSGLAIENLLPLNEGVIIFRHTMSPFFSSVCTLAA